jgi:hypothetical protein
MWWAMRLHCGSCITFRDDIACNVTDYAQNATYVYRTPPKLHSLAQATDKQKPMPPTSCAGTATISIVCIGSIPAHPDIRTHVRESRDKKKTHIVERIGQMIRQRGQRVLRLLLWAYPQQKTQCTVQTQ